MIVDRRSDESGCQFPVGMRVLAVDDDPICLMLLETLLRKCQYRVTTRDRAVDALKLLRENEDMFDLVISDVHMPDMDGFKLLELVGLEMDLPVIMLSANGDTKLVMKGITHGACDYLLKPVRLEELKNIWQHVIRRKKSEKNDQHISDNRAKRTGQAIEEQEGVRISNSDQDARLGKRRKDLVDDTNEQENEENEHEDEDPSSQKKARIVWSGELHRKFVAAVNHLGYERAVPKKILDMMNVENLTRENVASHLQKYRLYLKRLSSVANQQANMVAALGGVDSSFMHMNSMNFQNYNNSAQFRSTSLRSLPTDGILEKLNFPASLGLNRLSPSGISPSSPRQMWRTSIADPSKFQSDISLRDQTNGVLQGMPTSLEFDQLQLQHTHKSDSHGMGGEISSSSKNHGIFPNDFLEAKIKTTSSSSLHNNPVENLPNDSLLLQRHYQGSRSSQSCVGSHQSSTAVVPFDSSSSLCLPGQTQSSGSWVSGVQSSGFQSDSTPPNSSYSCGSAQMINSTIDGSSLAGLNVGFQLDELRLGTKFQATSPRVNLAHNMGTSHNCQLDMGYIPAFSNSSMNSSAIYFLGATDSPSRTSERKNLRVNGNKGFSVVGQPRVESSSTLLALPEVSSLELNGDYLTDQGRSSGNLTGSGAGSLEDVVNSMNGWGQGGRSLNSGVNVASDMYPMRTCI